MPSPGSPISARVFGLVVLIGPVLWSGRQHAGLALRRVAMIWAHGQHGAERLELDQTVLIATEGALIGTVCAL